MKRIVGFLLVGALAGCGGTEQGGTDAPSEFIEGLNPPPVAEGYERYVTPVIHDIQPGEDGIWCQYLSGAFDQDMDVIDVMGEQSTGGHHLIFYATSNIAPVGTTRECSDADMLSLHFLGGIGGEGAGAVADALPSSAVFRIPKGYALMSNTHFLNTSAKTMDGQGYLDLKLAPADATKTAASMFVNINSNVLVPAHQSATLEANCPVQEDLKMFAFGNHMHEKGKSIYTEIIHADGTKELLRTDETWNEEMVFNPKFNIWSVEQPVWFRKGDTIHTHCEWNNDTTEDRAFPTEMCVGFGIFLGGSELHCIDGVWGAQ